MISIPGSLSFTKLMMMSSTPAKSAGGARYAFQDPFICRLPLSPGQSRLQSVFGVRSFYVECKKMDCSLVTCMGQKILKSSMFTRRMTFHFRFALMKGEHTKRQHLNPFTVAKLSYQLKPSMSTGCMTSVSCVQRLLPIMAG